MCFMRMVDLVTNFVFKLQFKEMGGRARPSEPPRALEQSAEKKKGLGDWINKLKPVNEEKDHWVTISFLSFHFYVCYLSMSKGFC